MLNEAVFRDWSQRRVRVSTTDGRRYRGQIINVFPSYITLKEDDTEANTFIDRTFIVSVKYLEER